MHAPRSGDPSWVADRLREGKPVWRIRTSRLGYEIAVWRNLRALEDLDLARSVAAETGVVHGARPGHLKKLCRIERNAERMHPDALLRAAETYGRSRRPAPTEEVDFDPERVVAEPATLDLGAVVWRRLETADVIVAAGRALRNCLEHLADDPRRFGSYSRGRHEVWLLTRDGRPIMIAEADVARKTIVEARGPQNAPPSAGVDEAVLGALERSLRG